MSAAEKREGWVRKGLVLGAAGIVTMAAAFGVELIADERLTEASQRSLLVAAGAVFAGGLIMLCQAILRRITWR